MEVGDETTGSAGAADAAKGGSRGGGGGGGGDQKRHKQKHGAQKPRPAAHVPPADLPLPEGGLHVDGSLLEGGGQILRNSSALCAILGTPLKVDKIRAGRDKPGLRPQHLTGLQLIAELCSGRLQGGEVGSSCITLQPGRLACGRHVADTRTAGSCMLLAQSALPCLLYAGDGEPAAAPEAAQGAAAAAAAEGAPWLQAACARGTASVLDLRGGTDAAMAPPVGYMQHVLLPTLRSRLGVRAALERGRRGFFPKGQGHVTLAVERLAPGACLPALDLTQRGEVTSITIRAFTAGRLVPTIGERLAAAAQKEVKSRMPHCGVPRSVPVAVEMVHEPPERAFGDGCGILLTAETSAGCVLGASGLGERGVRAEDIGARAAGELLDALASGACTDEWLQDQLIIFMALAKGRSRMLTGEPTLHTRTACMVAQALTAARFSIRPAPGGGGLYMIECEGAGVAAPGGGAESGQQAGRAAPGGGS